MKFSDMLLAIADQYCASQRITKAELGLRVGGSTNLYWRLRAGSVNLKTAQAILDMCGVELTTKRKGRRG